MQILGVLLACSLAQAGPQATELPREVLALSRIQRKAVERLLRLPNYTCLQSIDRWTRASNAAATRQVDTVRLEVAHVGDRELFSWPGEQSFSDRRPSEIVGAGMTSTGGFALHLKAVFQSGGTIRFAREEDINGRRVLRYDYRVPIYLGRLHINVAGREGVAATKGSFWADAETEDVMRLQVEADQIPPDLPVSAAVTMIDFGRVRIGAEDVWLPQHADELMILFSGAQDHNITEYTHCRQYAAQSAVRFGEETAPVAKAPPAIDRVEVQLPAGVTLAVDLETEIDSRTATVGDLLSAVVSEDVSVRSGLTIPKGALLKGRLRLLLKENEPSPHFIVGLEFTAVEFGNRRAAFYGRLAEMPRVAGLEVMLMDQVRRTTGTEVQHVQSVHLPNVPGISTFFMKGAAFHLPKGMRMLWRTDTPRR